MSISIPFLVIQVSRAVSTTFSSRASTKGGSAGGSTKRPLRKSTSTSVRPWPASRDTSASRPCAISGAARRSRRWLPRCLSICTRFGTDLFSCGRPWKLSWSRYGTVYLWRDTNLFGRARAIRVSTFVANPTLGVCPLNMNALPPTTTMPPPPDGECSQTHREHRKGQRGQARPSSKALPEDAGRLMSERGVCPIIEAGKSCTVLRSSRIQSKTF